jgi:hypothetical protein
VRSTVGVLHFPPSQYTYRQRILETAILLFLQCLGVGVLHYRDPSSGCSIGSFESPLFLIGFAIDVSVSNRSLFRKLAFWAILEVVFRVFRDSPDVLIIESALRYITPGFSLLYYHVLAMAQFYVNHHDQLQWLFLGLSIVAVITKHWLSSAESSTGLQALIFTLPLAITTSMVCSACLHGVWRFLLGNGELERKVRLLVHRANKMVPVNLLPYLDFEDIVVENRSIGTSIIELGP